MAHLHPEINGDCNRVMRAVRTDTDESGLVGQVQHQKRGQDWCQEPNGVCDDAEEQLSGS